MTFSNSFLGWNLVGYPSLTAQTPAAAFAPIAGCYSIAWVYDATDAGDPWKKYDPAAPAITNDLKTIRPGMAVWLNITNPSCTWTLP